MAAERQVPGGPFVNEVGTAQRQVPGGPFVNETAGSGGSDITIALTGQAATTAQGTLGLQTAKDITGQVAATAQGTLGLQTSIAVAGQAAATAQGTITASVGGDITIALSGQAVTSEQGTLGLATTRAVSGQAAATAQGAFGFQFATTIAGQAVTTAQGTITATGGAAMSYTKNANLYLGIGSDLSILLGNPRMPAWNTAGRPGAPLDYTYGFNTDTAAIEVWTGSAWV